MKYLLFILILITGCISANKKLIINEPANLIEIPGIKTDFDINSHNNYC